MGRWASVSCACPDTRPLNPDRSWEPGWTCGHRHACLIGLSPRWIWALGEALKRTFDDAPDWLSWPPPPKDSPPPPLSEVLADARALCAASRSSGNPIELFT